jgi:hypothetical protein
MKRHDIEHCGIICRYGWGIFCSHPKLGEKKWFGDYRLWRVFPEWCPLPDVTEKEEQK